MKAKAFRTVLERNFGLIIDREINNCILAMELKR